MTVLETLKETGWEYVKDEQGESWEIDQLATDLPEWVQGEGSYNTDRNAVIIIETSEELIDGDPELTARSKAAATLGRKGGQARSEKKTAASRENGKKGGRPRRVE